MSYGRNRLQLLNIHQQINRNKVPTPDPLAIDESVKTRFIKAEDVRKTRKYIAKSICGMVNNVHQQLQYNRLCRKGQSPRRPTTEGTVQMYSSLVKSEKQPKTEVKDENQTSELELQPFSHKRRALKKKRKNKGPVLPGLQHMGSNFQWDDHRNKLMSAIVDEQARLRMDRRKMAYEMEEMTRYLHAVKGKLDDQLRKLQLRRRALEPFTMNSYPEYYSRGTMNTGIKRRSPTMKKPKAKSRGPKPQQAIQTAKLPISADVPKKEEGIISVQIQSAQPIREVVKNDAPTTRKTRWRKLNCLKSAKKATI